MTEVDKSGRKSFRKFARVQVALRTLIKAHSPRGELTCIAGTKNLGRGGVCLQADENIEELLEFLTDPAARVQLAITLKEDPSPMGGSIKTTWIPCGVKWVVTPSREESPLVAGLEFDANDTSNIAKVDEFIEYFIRSKKEHIYRSRIETVLKDADEGGKI